MYKKCAGGEIFLASAENFTRFEVLPMTATTNQHLHQPMSAKPKLSEMIEGALDIVKRVESILDRAEARERVMQKAIDENLEDPALADLQWCVAGELGGEADPTRRDLPFPDNCPPLPTLTEGKTRWINRGDFRNFKPFDTPPTDRVIYYLRDRGWHRCFSFSGPFIHIEAV